MKVEVKLKKLWVITGFSTVFAINGLSQAQVSSENESKQDKSSLSIGVVGVGGFSGMGFNIGYSTFHEYVTHADFVEVLDKDRKVKNYNFSIKFGKYAYLFKESYISASTGISIFIFPESDNYLRGTSEAQLFCLPLQLTLNFDIYKRIGLGFKGEYDIHLTKGDDQQLFGAFLSYRF